MDTPAPSETATPVRQVRGACPHDCPDTCSMVATVQEGRLVRLQGNPDHPSTRGALCTKVARYGERMAHPDRLLQPLRRVGPKGSGQFEPVDWDTALADIASRWKSIAARDPQAILPYSYAGTMGLVQGESMAARFFHRLGASLLDRTICASAGAAGLSATYGGKVGMRMEQFAHSRLILIWGSNAIASNLHFWTAVQEAKRAGAVVWCIDPRRTETAEKCHRHLALMPGTDAALALGLMRELMARDWLDHDYLQAHVEGYEELRALAEPWTLERTAQECGVSAQDVAELAQAYGACRSNAGGGPAAIRLNYGMQRARGGGNAVRLIALLPCLIGAWRHPAGGLLLSSSGWFAPVRADAWLQRPDLLDGRQPRTLNMSTLGNDLLHPGDAHFGPPVQALVVYNSNPLAVAPESALVQKGLAREDLFTVVLEHFMTDTADWADYVLPATMQLEHWDVHTSYGHTDVLLNTPALRPKGQCRSNAQIFRDFARAMGFDDPCFRDDDETLARGALRGVDFASLQERGWWPLDVPLAPFAQGGFLTPNGKARVSAPGLGLPQYVPNYESARSRPDLAQRYPLAMISPPARHFLNSTFVNVQSLRSVEGEPLLELHPLDAAARGVTQGQMVVVFNDRGRYHCKVDVTDRARPGVVHGLGIWWRKFGPRGTNVNELTHQQLTDLGRAPSFYDCLVEVQAAQD